MHVSGAWRLQALGPLTAGDVHHVTLSLSRVDGATEIARDRAELSPAELSRPILVSQLRSRSVYRLTARAYGAPGDDAGALVSEPEQAASAAWRVEDLVGLPPLKLHLPLRAVPRLVLTTLAGKRTAGHTDGPALRAQLEAPAGLAVGAGGRVYVSEPSAHRIRVLTPSGEVRTLAGGTPGHQDGPLAGARFRAPTGLVSDDQGFLYVADSGNHCIRRVTPEGTVETLTPKAGSEEGGPAAALALVEPTGLALGDGGELWVADAAQHSICRVSPQGAVSTVAGGVAGDADGQGARAGFRRPQGLAWSRTGQLFVADTGNHRLRVVTRDGRVTTLAGSVAGLEDGPAASARFREPAWLALGAGGQLYVADAANHALRRVNPTGHVSTLLGASPGFVDGPRPQALLASPAGLGFDGPLRLLVADQGNHALRLLQ
ncbi:MAG: hypothetical protein VKS61_03075 [Candidatus Sericytochromatia bacterium]|nr:hypothetical protein [Candidatus Sericytochromatia bacterium]